MAAGNLSTEATSPQTANLYASFGSTRPNAAAPSRRAYVFKAVLRLLALTTIKRSAPLFAPPLSASSPLSPHAMGSPC
eukprot:4067157-Pleurochrysis_carterae.AAC.1